MDLPDAPIIVLLRHGAGPDDRYVQAFAERGITASCVPVLAFQFPNQPALRERLSVPDRYAGLIATSPRAVRAVAEARDAVESWAAWTTKPAYAVGPKTAATLRGLGIDPQGEQTGSAGALSAVIEKKENPYLFVCGNRRREVLPEALREAGISFEELMVYKTILRTDLEIPVPRKGDWLVFFSPSGVEAISTYAPEQMKPYRLATIGPTTAESLRTRGQKPEAVAHAPSPEALVAAIERAARG